MIKIFNIGSCRTSFATIMDTEVICKKNYDLTHTSKEVLMYLDFFEDPIKYENFKYKESLMKDPNKFVLNTHKTNLNKSDIVTVELSSLKLIKYENSYYQINRAKNIKQIEPIRHTQNEESLRDDILEIEKRINKPVIFFGHVDLDFYDIPKVHGHIEERTFIDECLQKYAKNYILVKDTFNGIDYKEVFDFSIREDDTSHLNLLGKKMLFDTLKNKIQTI